MKLRLIKAALWKNDESESEDEDSESEAESNSDATDDESDPETEENLFVCLFNKVIEEEFQVSDPILDRNGLNNVHNNVELAEKAQEILDDDDLMDEIMKKVNKKYIKSIAHLEAMKNKLNASHLHRSIEKTKDSLEDSDSDDDDGDSWKEAIKKRSYGIKKEIKLHWRNPHENKEEHQDVEQD